MTTNNPLLDAILKQANPEVDVSEEMKKQPADRHPDTLPTMLKDALKYGGVIT